MGGSVRDLLLGLTPNDWDIEVHHLSAQATEAVLKRIGRCDFVGKQFGVYKLMVTDARGAHFEVDVALPRSDVKTGTGHQAFAVTSDPDLGYKKAASRRDFTINAMLYRPEDGQFLDFFGGIEDLQQRVLRHVSAAFVEDPLRPLRAMQFAARFQLSLSPDTAQLCAGLGEEITGLSKSRVWQEWRKWAMAPTPSYGLQALQDMGMLVQYPELFGLVGCQQDAKWHPEGDVWVHTCFVVDAMALICRDSKVDGYERLVLMFAALCHDLGKPIATRVDGDEVICKNHAELGRDWAKCLMVRMAAPDKVQSAVLPLVVEHVAHFDHPFSLSQVRQLAYRLQPANIRWWEMLTHADAAGCPPLPVKRPAMAWLEAAEHEGCRDAKVSPIITGKMLRDFGVEPSPAMGRWLDYAYQAQMSGEFSDEKSATIWLENVMLQAM